MPTSSLKTRIADLESVHNGRLQPRALRSYMRWNTPLLGPPGDQVVFRIPESSHHAAYVVPRLPDESDDDYWDRAELLAVTAPCKPGLAPLPLVEAYYPDLGGEHAN